MASAYEVILRKEYVGLLRVEDINKTFVTTRALKKVTFAIDECEEVRLSALLCISRCCELSLGKLRRCDNTFNAYVEYFTTLSPSHGVLHRYCTQKGM